MSNSTHGKPPYPAQKPKSKSRIAVRLLPCNLKDWANLCIFKKSQPERYVYNGSMNDNAMNIIIEQLEANLETYTEVQAQEAFDLSRASRGVIHAEEMYTIERLVEGRVQMRALENKAVEVKNRLRIADLQLTLLTRRLESYGFILSDENPQDFIGRLQTKPLLHAQLTASNVGQLSSLPPDMPPTATDLILQEPISKLDISTWTRGTPEFHIPNDESSTSVLREDTGSELAGAPVI